MGPGRYRGRCRDAVTNSDAESYALTNSHACCMRADDDANTYSHSFTNCYSHSNRNADINTHGNSYRNANCYCNTNSHRYGYTHAYCYTSS